MGWLRKLWRWITGAAWAERTLDEFEERFPGSCPICAYHRFGLMEGYESGPVQEHSCLEKKQ